MRQAATKARLVRMSAGNQGIRAGAALNQGEDHERHSRNDEESDDQGIEPTARGAFIECKQQREEADRQRRDARIVDALIGRARSILGDDPHR